MQPVRIEHPQFRFFRWERAFDPPFGKRITLRIGNGLSVSRFSRFSDRVFLLANEAARAVDERYPGKMVGLYAHNEHSEPSRWSVRVRPAHGGVYTRALHLRSASEGVEADAVRRYGGWLMHVKSLRLLPQRVEVPAGLASPYVVAVIRRPRSESVGVIALVTRGKRHSPLLRPPLDWWTDRSSRSWGMAANAAAGGAVTPGLSGGDTGISGDAAAGGV